MERIVIEVNKATAKKWRSSSKQEKRKIASALQQVLELAEITKVNEPATGYARPAPEVVQSHYERVQKELPEYKELMDELSRKAAERGLTEEILKELLRTDD